MSQASRAWEESSRVGISGVADKRSVINVADLARQEASRHRANKETSLPALHRHTANLPVPDGLNEPARSTVDAPSGDLDGEDLAITEAPPTNTAVSHDERSGPTGQQRAALGPGGLAATPTAMASFPAVEDNGFSHLT